MAKPLVFLFGDVELSFHLNKVDRSKLYGYKDLEAIDEDGQRCELATLAGDGRTVVASGGTALGYVAIDGLWCDKTQLKPVDLDGKEIIPVKSSFSEPVKLLETATVDQYLEHTIRSIYLLEATGSAAALMDELKRGAIFSFPYSFRGGLEANAGFLLMGADGNIFLAIGSPTQVEFLGLQETATAEEAEEETEETEMMDFEMI